MATVKITSQNNEGTNEEDDILANGVELFLQNESTVMKFPSYHYISVREEVFPICPASEVAASLPLVLDEKPSTQVVLEEQHTLLSRNLTESSFRLPTQPVKLVTWALAPLATFSIIGVLIRFSLGIIFGPGFANVTNDNTPLFKELPANMVGSFFMGWVGAVFKKDIAEFSELLAIGLSTGLMGSITTFGSWNQSMIERATKGNWVCSLWIMLIGMELSQMSFGVGVQTAEGVKQLANFIRKEKHAKIVIADSARNTLYDRLQKNLGHFVFLVVSGGMWIMAGALVILDKDSDERRRLWLSCMVAPLGTWTRWFLTQLNGRGLGKGDHPVKWLPIGTLITNISAAVIESTLALIHVLTTNQDCKMLTFALRLGFVGCMSTVSTMVAEVHLLNKATCKRWRAYIYIFVTFSISFLMGLLIYSLPLWLSLKDA